MRDEHRIETTRWKNGAIDFTCTGCSWSRSLPPDHSSEDLREVAEDAREHDAVMLPENTKHDDTA